jgi:hypothetical protein
VREDMTDLLLQLLTVGGPMAVIAVLSIYWNHQLMVKWIDRIEGLELRMEQVYQVSTNVAKALGEVTEALRRLNERA